MNVTYLTILILLVIYFILRISNNVDFLMTAVIGCVLILYDSYMTMGNKFLKL